MKEDNLSIDAVYSKYYDKIFMVTNAQTSILSKVNAIINDAQKLVSYEYVPESGKDKGTLTTKYIWNNTLVVWFADSAIKMVQVSTSLCKWGHCGMIFPGED